MPACLLRLLKVQKKPLTTLKFPTLNNRVIYIGRKEIFYLTIHSIHFYSWIYGIGQGKGPLNQKGDLLTPHWLFFSNNNKGSFICTIKLLSELKKEICYLMMYSTHFIYGYMESDI